MVLPRYPVALVPEGEALDGVPDEVVDSMHVAVAVPLVCSGVLDGQRASGEPSGDVGGVPPCVGFDMGMDHA